MRGIYFINEKLSLHGFSEKESFAFQKQAIQTYILDHNIQMIKLNPYQIYEHYSVLHALYYDLKMKKMRLDCLLLYSLRNIEDYASAYPARWLILKSYFNEIINVSERISHYQP